MLRRIGKKSDSSFDTWDSSVKDWILGGFSSSSSFEEFDRSSKVENENWNREFNEQRHCAFYLIVLNRARYPMIRWVCKAMRSLLPHPTPISSVRTQNGKHSQQKHTPWSVFHWQVHAYRPFRPQYPTQRLSIHGHATAHVRCLPHCSRSWPWPKLEDILQRSQLATSGANRNSTHQAESERHDLGRITAFKEENNLQPRLRD